MSREEEVILTIRCNKKTAQLWKELLYEYKKFGKKANDLLYDSLSYFKTWEIEKMKRKEIY
jgi:hypothetical protein